MVGVGRKVTGAVPSLSCPASPVPKCCYSTRDGGAVTGVSGWDPGHIHCGSGGLTPPVLGAVAEWPAFNAFVWRAVGRRGRLSFVPRGGLERGGDVLRGRGSRGEPSSEAEMSYPLEGRSATLERGGDCPAGPRGMRTGRTLDFYESFPFFRMESRPWAFVSPVALTGVCVFKAILVPRLGCP